MKKLILILLCLVLTGCVSSNVTRGVNKKENVFYSSSNPNIQIQLPKFSTYIEGGKGQMKHQFRDGRTTIYIHVVNPMPNETQIDYFNNPESWMFSNVPQSEKINKGVLTILDKKWYYCNSLKKEGQKRYFIRNLGYFAPNHAQFYIRFVERLSQNDSQILDDHQYLTSKQYEFMQGIIDTFDDKIKILIFVPKEK